VCVFGVKCSDLCVSDGAVAQGADWYSDAGKKWRGLMANMFWLLGLSSIFLLFIWIIFYSRFVGGGRKFSNIALRESIFDMFILLAFSALGLLFSYFSYLFWLNFNSFAVVSFFVDSAVSVYDILLEDKSIFGGHFIMAFFNFVFSVLYFLVISIVLVVHSMAGVYLLILSILSVLVSVRYRVFDKN
jgi:hypothetical protein